MSTNRIYSCNFCARQDYDLRPANWQLFGVHWETYPDTRIVVKPKAETENHICSVCVDSIIAAFKGISQP